MELVFLRHAPTDWNREHRYQGHTDVPLSQQGRQEALSWRGRVKQPDVLFSSPLLRAKETAELLFPGQEIFLVEELREMNLGRWEGKTLAELQGLDPSVKTWPGLDSASHGGETYRQVMQRLERWLQTLPTGSGKRAVVVSHKATITALYCIATGWDAASRPKERMRFPRIHRFFWDGALQILSLNEPLAEAPCR